MSKTKEEILNTIEPRTSGIIIFRNSWGVTWGVNGDGYFGENYIKWVYAIGTAIDNKQITEEVLPRYNYTRDLTIGFSGNDVSALQKLLVAKGYLIMPEGVSYGYFGSLTKTALAKFQKDNNIYPSAGYFGSITRKFISG